jgi:AbrB family looped-hinge helix DNA binding protein
MYGLLYADRKSSTTTRSVNQNTAEVGQSKKITLQPDSRKPSADKYARNTETTTKKRYIAMGESLVIDERGRITIPIEIRQQFGIEPGDEFEINFSEGIIKLIIKRKEIQRIRTNKKWDESTFLKAGEATFED